MQCMHGSGISSVPLVKQGGMQRPLQDRQKGKRECKPEHEGDSSDGGGLATKD